MDPLSLPGAFLALLIRAFVAQPFTIPASSMLPTLEVGDYMLASKSAYGYSRFSLPMGAWLPAFELMKMPPQRGDVVIFRLPSDLSVDYVKRVIGLEGDRVQVIGGVTHLNGTPLKREPVAVYRLKEPVGGITDAIEYRETLPEGRSYDIIDLEDNSPGDDTAEFVVPPGHCFVMGDNRDNSNDSRFTIGFIPYANVYAKAWLTVDYSGKTLKAHQIK